MILWGYAAVWWAPSAGEYSILGLEPRMERFEIGAFDRSLKGSIRALWGHNDDAEIASTSDASLEVWSDHIGLAFLIRPRPGSDRFVDQVRTGRARGMSVRFRPVNWASRFVPTLRSTVRTIVEGTLRELSIVETPAYPQTCVIPAKSLPLFMLRRRLDYAAQGW